MFAKSILTTALVFTFVSNAEAASTTKKKVTTEVTTTTIHNAPVTSSSSGSSAFSNVSDWEFTTAPTSGTFTSAKACKDCSSVTLFGASLGAHKNIQGPWQGGFEAGFLQVAKSSGSSSTTMTFTLIGLATYNLDSYLEESAFVRGGIGLYPVSKVDGTGDYENKFGFLFAAGKRFRLASNISYMPEIRLVKKGDIDFGIEGLPVNFSARF